MVIAARAGGNCALDSGGSPEGDRFDSDPFKAQCWLDDHHGIIDDNEDDYEPVEPREYPELLGEGRALELANAWERSADAMDEADDE